MSVWAATKDAFEEHPYIVIGGVAVGVLAIFYLKNRGGSGQQPANFTFSYGPSDAQVKAGTDLAIAQAGNNAALAAANLKATTDTTIAGDYFGYLTGANGNAAALGLAQTAASVDITQANDAAQIAVAQGNNATQLAVAQGAQKTSLLQTLASLSTTAFLSGKSPSGVQLFQNNAGGITLSGAEGNPAMWKAMGYTDAQIANFVKQQGG